MPIEFGFRNSSSAQKRKRSLYRSESPPKNGCCRPAAQPKLTARSYFTNWRAGALQTFDLVPRLMNQKRYVGSMRVVSQRKYTLIRAVPGETVIKVDRSNPVLGNKHILYNHHDHGARRKVIEAFRKDLDKMIRERVGAPLLLSVAYLQ